jgi:hypothetical protein
MEKSHAFQAWGRDYYLTEYPSLPRASVGFSAEDVEQDGFRLIGQEEYQNFVQFSLETLVDYLVTQSNASAAVEGGKERIEDVRHWLTENLAPYMLLGSKKED